MSDISKCTGEYCLLKETCWRYLVPPHDFRQAWVSPQYSDSNECPNYWKVDDKIGGGHKVDNDLRKLLAANDISLDRIAVSISQTDDCVEGDGSGQYMDIDIVDGGGGHFAVIKTERWAFDNGVGIEQLRTFIDVLFELVGKKD